VSEFTTQVVKRLRLAGVELGRGLADTEFGELEERLGFSFAPAHRAFLTTVLPVGDGWVDWRHSSLDDLRTRLDAPIQGLLVHVPDSFWPHSWGDRPARPAWAKHRARERLNRAPRLVPLYGHRYLVADSRPQSSPVFSVHETDVIYFGRDLLEYVSFEFEGAAWHQPVQPGHVPFWSDLATGVDQADL